MPGFGWECMYWRCDRVSSFCAVALGIRICLDQDSSNVPPHWRWLHRKRKGNSFAWIFIKHYMYKFEVVRALKWKRNEYIRHGQIFLLSAIKKYSEDLELVVASEFLWLKSTREVTCWRSFNRTYVRGSMHSRSKYPFLCIVIILLKDRYNLSLRCLFPCAISCRGR